MCTQATQRRKQNDNQPGSFSEYLSYYIASQEEGADPGCLPTLESLKKDYIHYLLGRTDFNISQAAEILKISRSSLYNKIQRYGLISA